MIATIAAVGSTIIAMIAAFFAFGDWKRRENRIDDVLAWSNEAIDCLETIVFLSLTDKVAVPPDVPASWARMALLSSCLVERGRMFFRNQVIDRHGHHKPEAYRGYRPCILDHLVLAHQIAMRWPDSDETDRTTMRRLALDALRQFVSLAQKEVGRSRTASADTSQGGMGVHLDTLLAAPRG